MEKKVKEFILKENLIEKGDKVLLGLSGGPDSVFLFHILKNLMDDLSFSMSACHVNHNIRGEEALRDEKFSEELCSRYGIPFYSASADIPALSLQRGLSIEETARDERYRIFSELMNEEGFDKICLAHNMNDQAETIIQRFFRGTGISGLKGIRPLRDKIYIRPILEIRREEIEEYLKVNSFEYVRDSTNDTGNYGRNVVRNEVIPFIRENFNSSVVRTLYNMGEIMASEDSFMEEMTLKALEGKVRKSEDKTEVSGEIFSLHDALVKRCVRKILMDFTGSTENVYSVYITDIIGVMHSGTGKSVDLPGGVVASNVYGTLILSRNNKLKYNKETNKLRENDKINITLEILNEPQSVDMGKYTVTVWKSSENTVKTTAVLDMGDIKKITIRTRQDGDRMKPLGMQGNRKLKSILIDRKVPRDEREELPVIVSGEEIIYLHPQIISEDYKVTEKTAGYLFLSVSENR